MSMNWSRVHVVSWINLVHEIFGAAGTDEELEEARDFDCDDVGEEPQDWEGSVFEGMSALERISAIFCENNIDENILRELLSEFDPVDYATPAMVDLDIEQQRQLIPPAYSEENLGIFSESETLIYQVCTRHHFSNNTIHELLRIINNPRFDQHEVGQDLVARVSARV